MGGLRTVGPSTVRVPGGIMPQKPPGIPITQAARVVCLRGSICGRQSLIFGSIGTLLNLVTGTFACGCPKMHSVRKRVLSTAGRAGRPCDQHSIATVRPSIQPSSSNHPTNEVIHGCQIKAAVPGQYRHGERTKAAIAEQQKFSALLKMLRVGLT